MTATRTLPALHSSHAGHWLLEPDGHLREVDRREAILSASATPHLLLNAPLPAARLGYADLSGLDVLELFAFVRPASFCVPTPKGLAAACGLAIPRSDAEVPALLGAAADYLLDECRAPDWPFREGAWSALQGLARARWSWAAILAPYVRKPDKPERWLFTKLPDWEERPPPPPPKPVTLSEDEVLARLDGLTGTGAEKRPGQRSYAAAARQIFDPRERGGEPHVLLAQAGTGIGKTLGYLAPASLYAQRGGGSVWVSTYTKNLQRQLRQESARAWPGLRKDGAPPVVVRKGRENYLCLLNLEDALQGGFAGRAAVLAHLAARWAAYSEDGDLVGGDFPGWLGTLFGRRAIPSLTDRRGECVYAGCPHYRKCFIERSTRAAAGADLVIANHALVMVTAARGGSLQGGGQFPKRIVFDEGHHTFDAADATFAAALTGREAVELKRWLLGPERKGRGRRRGLAARLADVASYDELAGTAIAQALEGALALPSAGWLSRLAEGLPVGPVERFLAALRSFTYARDEDGQDTGYGIEADLSDLPPELTAEAAAAANALSSIRAGLATLDMRLEAVLADPPDWLDPANASGTGGRARIEGARHAIGWRVELLSAWEAMLTGLAEPRNPLFVEWLAVDRADGREYDVGLHRRWLDPMTAFAKTVLEPAHGVLFTSATLTDRKEDAPDWPAAERASGASQAGVTAKLIDAPSPFDYAGQAEILIVTDIARGDVAALAGAYARIIEATGGGVLGLFTAIRRLRAVHGRIADRLARAGLPIHAQHVDPIDTGTLTDMFRDDPSASLLGTDALRDGIDVPGASLRCVVMEAVPWPRPTILHRERRAAHPDGAKAYDDRIVRARLAQAFGRLIRRQDDRGHVIVLSPAFPSRLLSAFPAGTPVARVTLGEALGRLTLRLKTATGSAARACESAAL